LTRRLYQADSYKTDFESEVASVGKHRGKYAVILRETCFYPESGGQPPDTGILDGVSVENTIEENDDILHICAQEPTFGVGDRIKGKIDWQRRFSNMQQHTGQHVLSQAFLRALDAATVSSRLAADHATIDVSTLGLTWQQVGEVERLSNSIVFENRPVRVYEARQDEITGLRVKKAPLRDVIRVVEVEGFDRSPCGGTHCRMTGEVGLIKILRWEKVREASRIEFICGLLARADYSWKSRFMVELAQELTTNVANVPKIVTDLRASHKDLRRQVDRLKADLLRYRVAELETAARETAGVRIVSALMDDRTLPELREVAAQLTRKGRTAALLAARADGVHFVFSRSEDVAVDMREVIKAACEIVDGKGGGRPEVCQGGGRDKERTQEALTRAGALLEGLLSGKA
jgi:alanyl-tRNA synthetase